MSMVDFFTREEAIEALEMTKKTRKAFLAEVKKYDNLIFVLEYYLNTGEGLQTDFLDLPGKEEE